MILEIDVKANLIGDKSLLWNLKIEHYIIYNIETLLFRM
jgi:hypothetical protein